MKSVILGVSLLVILIVFLAPSVKSQDKMSNRDNISRHSSGADLDRGPEPISILDWLLGFTSRNVSRNAIHSQKTNHTATPSNVTTASVVHDHLDNSSISDLPQNSSTVGTTNHAQLLNVTESLERVGRQYFPPTRRRYSHPPITVVRNPELVDSSRKRPAPVEPTYNLYWNKNDKDASPADEEHNDFDEEEETQFNSDVDEVPTEEDSAESEDYDSSHPNHSNHAYWEDIDNGRTRLKPNEKNCTNSNCRDSTGQNNFLLQTSSHDTKSGSSSGTNSQLISKLGEVTGPEMPITTTTLSSGTVSLDPEVSSTATTTTTLSSGTVSLDPEMPSTATTTTTLSSGTVSLDPEVSSTATTTTTVSSGTVSLDPEVSSTGTTTTTLSSGTVSLDPEMSSTGTTTTTLSSGTVSLDPEVSTGSQSTITTQSSILTPPSTTPTKTQSTTPTTPPQSTTPTTTQSTTPTTPPQSTTPTSTPPFSTSTTALSPETKSTATTQISSSPPKETVNTPSMVTTASTSTSATSSTQPLTTTTTPLSSITSRPTAPIAPLTPIPGATLPPPLNTEAPIITDPPTVPPELETVPTEPQPEVTPAPEIPLTSSIPPSEPLFTDPPTKPTVTDPPTEPTFTDPPTEPTFTDPTTEPTFTDPPTEPTFTDPPTEPTLTDPPTEPIYTDPPTEPMFTDPTTEPTFTDPPTEPIFTDPPIEPTFTDPPTEPPFTDPPTEPPFTDPPTESPFTDPPTEPPIPETTSTPATTTDNTVTTEDTTMKPTKPPPPFNTTLRCQCGVQSVSAQSVGNTIIRLKTNPWLVEISVRGRHRCTGTLINDRYVLTAASCVRRIQSKSDLTVSSGLQSKFPVTHSVHKISIHPKYDFKTMSNNVAVLGIKDPIEPGPSARPVCLPFTNPNSKYETASLSTWISSANGRGRLSLLQSDVQLLNKTACQNALNMTDSSPKRIGNGTFCAEAPAQSSCVGDIGGMLQAYVGKSSYEQIGLVSWGVGCRSSRLPGVYSMVRPYIRWMLFQMRDGHFCRDRRPKLKDLSKLFELEDQI